MYLNLFSEHDKPWVPKTCCKKDQYGEYIELQKCQTWNQGPPGKQSGLPNEALFYEVRKMLYNYHVVGEMVSTNT